MKTSFVFRKDTLALCSVALLLGAVNAAYALNPPILEWAWTSSSVLPNSLNVMMTSSVIDLNKDGIPDVVFGSTASTGGGLVEVGVLRALNGNNGSELFTVTDSGLQINTAASVATGDIDGDGQNGDRKVVLNSCRRLLQLADSAREQGDVAAGFGEAARDGKADPA